MLYRNTMPTSVTRRSSLVRRRRRRRRPTIENSWKFSTTVWHSLLY